VAVVGICCCSVILDLLDLAHKLLKFSNGY
jgi:hypothetical protein